MFSWMGRGVSERERTLRGSEFAREEEERLEVAMREGRRAGGRSSGWRESQSHVFTHRLGVLEIENEDGPHLRVDFLQDERKPVLCDLDPSPLDFHQATKLQQLLDPAAELDAFNVHVHPRASHHVPQHPLPLPAGELVQLGYGNGMRVRIVAGHAEGLVVAPTGQSQPQGRRKGVGERVGARLAGIGDGREDVQAFEKRQGVVALTEEASQLRARPRLRPVTMDAPFAVWPHPRLQVCHW